VDSLTGTKREVDIVIRHSVGTHEITIGVECVSTARPASVQWVDRMAGTHTSLPTVKLVLVSAAGFTQEAIAKAAALRISTYTMMEATSVDWLSVVHSIPEVRFESFLLPYLSGVTVVLSGEPQELPDDPPAELGTAPLFDAAGKEVGTPVSEAQRWISDPSVIQAASEHAFTDSGTTIELDVPVKEGVEIRLKSGRRLPVHSIRVEAKCRREVQVADLRQIAYGGTAVTVAEGSVLDRDASIVFVQRPGEAARGAFRLGSPPNGPKDSG